MRRFAQLFIVMATAIFACEKTDPLYCQTNPKECGMGSGIDATDSPPLIDAQQCFGTDGFEVCLTDLPEAPINFPGAGTFDTTDGASVSPACLATQPSGWKLAGNRDACFLVGKSIEIDGRIDVIGDRPLVLVATTTILVGADLDVASHINGKIGPGAPDPACPGFSIMPVTNSSTGGGGGAGGTFMAQGGGGGGANNIASSGGGPTVALSSPPLVLRSGCDGQDGGGGQGSAAGPGGPGGGAVYLVAGTGITVTSGVRINASGAGGKGPSARIGGGGGGGAGGMIVLSAPSIIATGAVLMANGGGGASGGDNSGSGNAVEGGDPIDPAARAIGGNNLDTAGDGGAGWIQGDSTGGPGNTGAGTRGGGGGGGGGGYIQTSVSSGATASPTPVIK